MNVRTVPAQSELKQGPAARRVHVHRRLTQLRAVDEQLDREVTHSRNGNLDSAHRGEAKPFSAAVGAEVPRFGKYWFANGLAILVIDDAKLCLMPCSLAYTAFNNSRKPEVRGHDALAWWRRILASDGPDELDGFEACTGSQRLEARGVQALRLRCQAIDASCPSTPTQLPHCSRASGKADDTASACPIETVAMRVKLVASMGADEPSDFEIRRSREG